jgi:flagellar biosynthesis/type III secretory pathway protein FliH
VIRAQYPQVRARALLDAEAAAAELLRAAHQEAEATRRAAEEEYETWRAQAIREGEEQVARDTAKAQLAALQVEARALAALREATIPLVLQATEKLVRATFDARPELVRGVITDAIAQLRLASELCVDVHPEDLAHAQALPPQERPVSFRVDASLARGECRVSSDVGAVDARFTTQLSALSAALHGATPGVVAANPAPGAERT